MSWRWTGRCIGGIYLGARTFLRSGRTVRGAFGMEGVNGEDPCKEPVTVRCQLAEAGKLLPFWWLACDNQEHRQNAGVIEHLDADGCVVRTTRMLLPPRAELAPERVEVPADAVEVLPAPKKRKRGKKKRAKRETVDAP